jgi:spermidine/putrescine transport system ATP-binding protein
VAGFIGSSNLIDGKVTRVEADRVEITTAGGLQVWAPCPAARPSCGVGAGLLVRPEMIQVGNGSPPSSAQKLQGRIVQSAFFGPHRQLTVEVEPGLELTAFCPPAVTLPPEARVHFWWNFENALILPE